MPILNKMLLLRVLAAIGVLGGGLFLVHYLQADRVPRALLWHATAAAEKGKTDKAIAYMRQYLEFKPDDHDSAVKLADMVLERAATLKDYTNAHFLYERVLRESPGRTDVGRKLVTLCLRLGRTEDAAVHATKLLEKVKDDGVLTAQLAECRVAQNRHDDARTLFEEAIGLAPDNVRAYEQYANLLKGHFKKPQDAGAVLDRMAAANSGRPEAFLARSRFLRDEGKMDLCLRDLERVLLLDPENADALIRSAELLQSRGDLRRAKETLQDAIILYPRDLRGYRALSWLELLSGNQAEAMTCLERGIAVLPDAAELLTPLADMWLEQGDFVRVASAIAKLDARRDAKSQIEYLRGRMAMKQGRWNEALAILEALRTDAMNNPGLAAQLNLLIAGCHERRADREAQWEALKRTLAAEPGHLGARVALANAHVSAGRYDDAVKEYRAAARSPYAGTGVALTYANVRLARAKLNGGPPEEWPAIAAVLGPLLESNPLAVDPVVLTAELAAARGDLPAAVKTLREACGRRPDDARLWAALAGFVSRSRGTLAAAAVLAEGQLAAGDAMDLKIERARLWADDDQPGQGRRVARLEGASATAADSDRGRLSLALADVYAMLRDAAGMKRIATQIAARHAADLSSRKTLFVLALEENDAAATGKFREEIERIEGPRGRSAALLAGLHEIAKLPASESPSSALQELARAARAETPDNADGHVLAAEIALRMGEPALALKSFDAAADLDPTALKYQRARIAHHLKTSSPEVLRSVLAKFMVDPRLPPHRARAAIKAAVRTESVGKCLAALAPEIGRDARTALWAGRMLEGYKKPAEALAIYLAITEAHPAFVDGWSGRLMAASRLGDAEVEAVLQAAAKALDKNAFFQICAEGGPTVRARLPQWSPPVTSAEDRRAYAEACLGACEARGRVEDAVPILAALAQDSEARPADVAWAKRTLAALATGVGTDEKRRDAVAALRGQGNQPADSISEARSRIAALTIAYRASRGDDRRAIVRELIGLLADVVRDPSATSHDWFQLAQFYRLVGDRTACRRCLDEMVKLEPNNLFYLAVNVDDLLSENRLEEAGSLVAKLADGVHDLRVTATAARYYALTHQPRTALLLVDRYVQAVDSGSAEAAPRQRQAADLLEQAFRLAAAKGIPESKMLLDGACERFRASLRAFPEAVGPMAALLAFDGQVKLAFEELERQKPRLSPAALALAGVGVLRSGHADARQFQAVRAWIDAALVADAGSVQLTLGRAELHALQQDFATAEVAYRDVLKTDPKNLVALNNLAWILSPRPESADQAMKYADRAIELSGATGELLDTRARILISAGQYDRAIADLNEAINQGQTPLRYFHLALAQLRLAHPEQAAKTFKEAKARGLDVKSIHPSDLPTYKLLADQAEG